MLVVGEGTLLREVAPAALNRIVAARRQKVAVHMKAKLYLPRSALRLMLRKLRRPRTNAALRLFRHRGQPWSEGLCRGQMSRKSYVMRDAVMT